MSVELFADWPRLARKSNNFDGKNKSNGRLRENLSRSKSLDLVLCTGLYLGCLRLDVKTMELRILESRRLRQGLIEGPHIGFVTFYLDLRQWIQVDCREIGKWGLAKEIGINSIDNI